MPMSNELRSAIKEVLESCFYEECGECGEEVCIEAINVDSIRDLRKAAMKEDGVPYVDV